MSAFSPRSSQEHADTFQALQKIAATAAELQIPFLLVGAMARDMLLEHVHDMSKERRTMDVDIGVMVGSWPEYSKFTAAMTGRGFEQHPHKMHNFRSEKGVVIIGKDDIELADQAVEMAGQEKPSPMARD